ncbi:hypothetical protein MBLNU230_g5662t1 [Neophaeotheca triangularis]
MQSLFRLPWSTDQTCGKMSDATNTDRSGLSPVVEIPILNKLKRKRAESAESESPPLAPQTKKPRPGSATPRPLLPAQPRLPAKSEAESALASAIPDVVAGAAQAGAGMSHASDRNEAPSVKGEASEHDLSQLTPTIPTAESMQFRADSIKDDVDMDPAPFTQPDATPSAPSLSDLQQTIENEFNMQILHKHNELRLIEQELAKCQIALEQLRRCEIKAYPGANGLSEEMSTGLGPAVLPPAGSTHPSHAAPYGVTDGPYTRHYSQWLIPDPAFDVAPASAQSTNTANDRSARASASSARKSSTKPAQVVEKSRKSFSSLPNYRAAPSPEKLKLAVVNRQADGKVVKLVCNNCHRFDFNSVQGFLNHCRIAHKVDYKSHEVAAVDCGSPLDEGELAQWQAQSQRQAQNDATPIPKRSAPKKEKASAASGRQASPSMPVPKEKDPKPKAHPLNRSSGNGGAFNTAQPQKIASRAPAAPLVPARAASSQGSTPFTPAAQTPYLSALFAKNKLGGDLQEATEKAKQKIDLSGEDDLTLPDIAAPNTPALSKVSDGPIGDDSQHDGLTAPHTLDRPPSRKGHRHPAPLAPAPRHRPSPLAPQPGLSRTLSSAQNQALNTEIPEPPSLPSHYHRQSHSPTNLSPHTIDSAPGLVSDVDGDDEEDDARSTFSENPAPAHSSQHLPASLPSSGRDCGAEGSEQMELDVAADEEMGEDGIVVRRNSLVDGPERAGSGPKLVKGKR